jgi:hypothetical protein
MFLLVCVGRVLRLAVADVLNRTLLSHLTSRVLQSMFSAPKSGLSVKKSSYAHWHTGGLHREFGQQFFGDDQQQHNRPAHTPYRLRGSSEHGAPNHLDQSGTRFASWSIWNRSCASHSRRRRSVVSSAYRNRDHLTERTTRSSTYANITLDDTSPNISYSPAFVPVKNYRSPNYYNSTLQ